MTEKSVREYVLEIDHMNKLKKILFLKYLKGIGKSFIYNKYWNQLRNSNSLEEIVKGIRYVTKVSESDIETALRKTEDQFHYLVGLKDVRILTVLDNDYPEKLKVMEDKRPLLLYVKGNVEALNKPGIAIIGTRHPSEWSQREERLFVQSVINKSDYIVISGLALGCDRIAHETTVREGGQTIAVLPSGFNEITPPSHKKLADDILNANGCIVSEYEPNEKPNNGSFIERDAVVAALSDITFSMECGMKSGTMHALDYANEYERVVGCYLPDDRSKGDYSGNEYVINEKRAIRVSDNEALMKLFEEASDRHTSTKDEEMRQLSLFDVGFDLAGGSTNNA